MCSSNSDDEAIAGQIHSLNSRAIAEMMLSATYAKHIAVIFLVVTCGATAPVNLVGDLMLLIIRSSRYF